MVCAKSLEELEQQVRHDLSRMAYPLREWVRPVVKDAINHPADHIYDVVIVGGGQCGLATAFGLMQEKVVNVLVLDENPEGLEGPWVTYARMVTLRTPKHITGPDLGFPCLTFQAYYEARFGPEAWSSLDKIPKEQWMEYLVWYRHVLGIPMVNDTKCDLIEPLPVEGRSNVFIYKLTCKTPKGDKVYLCRKVVLATGIQGGGEWHVPRIVKDSVPASLYAHTSAKDIDFTSLKGKRVAILGGGASAFDNARFGLERGVGEVHVFIRRPDLPRINPIRFMEFAGFLRHFSDLDDATKYAGIDFFLQFNQPPTNDTFNRAAKFPNFALHTASPWTQLEVVEGPQGPAGVRLFTPKGDEGVFDFLIISTGLLTDVHLRQELRAVAPQIATWGDRFQPGVETQQRNELVDMHPYLGPSFEFMEKVPGSAPYLRGIFAYNYSALASLGLSASALSGMKFAMPKLLAGITRSLFLDDKDQIISEYLAYNTEEFLGQWPLTAATATTAAEPAATAAATAATSHRAQQAHPEDAPATPAGPMVTAV